MKLPQIIDVSEFTSVTLSKTNNFLTNETIHLLVCFLCPRSQKSIFIFEAHTIVLSIIMNGISKNKDIYRAILLYNNYRRTSS